MIGILGGMGTQAGLDFCNKLAKINTGKLDQQYPMFVLYNKSNIPKRPENLKKYYNVLNSLVEGCKMLQKNNCKFIVMPCNTAHYWYDDLRKKVKIPILSMPKEVYLDTSKNCKKNSKIGILSTEATLSTKVYNKYFDKYYNLVSPSKDLQKNSVNKSIKLVKMGKIKEAEKVIRPAVNYLMKIKCKKIILGCTELPIAIFAYKSFKKIKQSKVFIDPNLLLANISMKKYKSKTPVLV
jgi:aspartate racemase